MNTKKLLTYAVIAILAWKAGLPLLRFLFGLLTAGLAAVFGSSGGVVTDPSSLRAAIRNVTTDYDQVTRCSEQAVSFNSKSQVFTESASASTERHLLLQSEHLRLVHSASHLWLLLPLSDHACLACPQERDTKGCT